MADKTNPNGTKQTTDDSQSRTNVTKAKKGFWARYIDRLVETRCTMTPPECR